MSDMPKCACLTVHYDPIHNSDGTNTSRWRCVDCKTEFSRVLSRVEVYGPGFNESIPYADTAPACRACGGIGSDDEGTGARCDVCDGSGLARSSAVDVDGEQGGGIGNDPRPDGTSTLVVEGAHATSSPTGLLHPRSPSDDATAEPHPQSAVAVWQRAEAENPSKEPLCFGCLHHRANHLAGVPGTWGRCLVCDCGCYSPPELNVPAATDVSEDQREGGQHGVTRTAGQPAHPGAATGSATGSTPTGDVGGSSGGGSREVLHVPDGPSREPQGGVGMDPTLDRASHRQRCAVCHQVDPVMFWVPGPVWGQVVPVEFQQSIVCLRCFVSYADEIMVAWDEEIAFAPVSLATHLRAVTPMDRGMHVRPAPTEAETPYDAIRAERERQEELRRSGKFKWTCADPAASPHHKMTVLAEEFGEVANAVLEHDDAQLWDELVQTAAVAVAWLEGLACSVTGTPSTWVNDEAAIDAAAFPGSTLAEIQEAARSCPEHAMKGVGQGFRYLERSPLHSDVGRLRELFTPLANHVWRGVERFTSDTDEHIVATAILREVDNLIYRITAARSSATGEPHVCAATGGECKFFGGEL